MLGDTQLCDERVSPFYRIDFHSVVKAIWYNGNIALGETSVFCVVKLFCKSMKPFFSRKILRKGKIAFI